MEGKMRKFQLPTALTQKVYNTFELLCLDIIVWNKLSVRQFKYSAIFVDKRTNKVFLYHMKHKSDLLQTIKDLISDYGGNRYPGVNAIKYILTDSMSEILSREVQDYLKSKGIQLQVSAPYLHEQNYAERFVQSIKDGIRSIMAYNNAPIYYYCYALDYYCYTFNHMPKSNHLKTREEEFTGVKSDLSHSVPFYAKGMYKLSDKSAKINIYILKVNPLLSRPKNVPSWGTLQRPQ
jgi:hypothetical protein